MTENELAPICEIVNIASPIKASYYENKNLEPTSDRHRFHVSLCLHNGLYWVTSIVQNLDQTDPPVIIPETFLEHEKELAKLLIRKIIDMPTINDWHHLWFCDGKAMTVDQFSNLRNLWLQTLLPNTPTNS
jgi:hypothetical protein